MAEPATIYSAQLNYLNEITADEIIVVFNGTTYTVPKRTRTLPNSDTYIYYGTLGLVDDGNATGDYPFCIYEAHDLNTVYVSEDVYNNHNPFTIKIMGESVSTTPCFDKARGYSCGEEMGVLTEESVTTTTKPIGDPYGELSYSQLIDADTIKVTFNGTEYECSRMVIEDVNLYGGAGEVDHDFSTYPFSIVSSAEGNAIFTESTGTYSIKIEGMLETVTTTTCFDKAVRSATTAYAHITSTMGDDGCAIMTLDITDEDLASIISKGQRLAIVDETTHSIIYPTFVYTRNATVTPEPMRLRMIVEPDLPLGIPTAMVTIAITANGDKEHLVTLYAYAGTASPRYLKGRLCMEDEGYSCEEETVTLTEESVTTTVEGSATEAYGALSYSQRIDADSIAVTFDGVEYECSRSSDGSYGAPYNESTGTTDWSEYPFAIISEGSGNTLSTPTAGTHTVTIKTHETIVSISSCFKQAVNKALDKLTLTLVGDGYGAVSEVPMSASAAWDALENGTEIVIHYRSQQDDNGYQVLYLDRFSPYNEYMYQTVSGDYYRFRGHAFSYDLNGQEAVHPGYHLDIFRPQNSDSYYWVYEDDYAGKHE